MMKCYKDEKTNLNDDKDEKKNYKVIIKNQK